MAFIELVKYNARFAIPDVPLQIKSISNVYELSSSAEHPEGGVEWEITLNNKPAATSFAIQFQAKDLVFRYQPPLTEELDPKEYDLITETEGWRNGERKTYRPPNVVGSYAVYHAYRRNNQYRTGKLFHIYRPHLVDAKGAEAWADLHIENNVLSVTLPTEFLDNATYPVTVDPTFGKTDIGGSEDVWQNHIICKYPLNENGNVTSIVAYIRLSSAESGYGTCYDDDGAAGKPGTLMGATGQSAIGDAFAWITFTYGSPLGLTAASWYIGVIRNTVEGQAIYYKYDAGDTGQLYYDEDDEVPPDNPWGSNTKSSHAMSVYANYTTPTTTTTMAPTTTTTAAPTTTTAAPTTTTAAPTTTTAAPTTTTAAPTTTTAAPTTTTAAPTTTTLAPTTTTLAPTTTTLAPTTTTVAPTTTTLAPTTTTLTPTTTTTLAPTTTTLQPTTTTLAPTTTTLAPTTTTLAPTTTLPPTTTTGAATTTTLAPTTTTYMPPTTPPPTTTTAPPTTTTAAPTTTTSAPTTTTAAPTTTTTAPPTTTSTSTTSTSSTSTTSTSTTSTSTTSTSTTSTSTTSTSTTTTAPPTSWQGGIHPLQPLAVIHQASQIWRLSGARLHSWSRTWRISGVIERSSSRVWKLSSRWNWLDRYQIVNEMRNELRKMSFARWDSFEACCLEQTSLGHSNDDADTICKSIMQRAQDGTLYKADQPMEILKSGEDIVLYGPATWELLDREGDFITTKAQVNFLRKLFTQVPERYRNIMDEHGNFQAGEPLLTFKTSDGRSLHSHVHEKGLMLLTKVRPDDGLAKTTELRQKVLNGTYHSYSIAGRPISFEDKVEKGQKMTWHYDIDPDEISLCREGINPKAVFEVVAKSKSEQAKTGILTEFDEMFAKRRRYEAISKIWENETKKILTADAANYYENTYGGDIQKPFADYSSFDDCVSKNQDKSNPEAFCAWLEHRTTGKWPSEKAIIDLSEADLELLKDMTWEECIAQARQRGARDPKALCGWLRWHGPNAPAKAGQAMQVKEQEQPIASTEEILDEIRKIIES